MVNGKGETEPGIILVFKISFLYINNKKTYLWNPA